MFDSGRAFEHVRQLVAIGPRPAGSPGIEAARRYISDQMKAVGLPVVEQRFEGVTPFGRVKMANLLVTIPGASPDRLIIARALRHQAVPAVPIRRRQRRRIERGHAARARARAEGAPQPFTIELVFFDGEEAVVEWTGTDHTYGSRHYVEAARTAGTLQTIRAHGARRHGRRSRSAPSGASRHSTPWLTEIVWAAAGRLGHGDVFLDRGDARSRTTTCRSCDAGVPAIDIIDLDYAAWHTADDTLDKVSARSLQTVGDVLLEALPKIEARLRRQ